jgi:putative membrane protein
VDWSPPLSVIAGLVALQALYLLCVGPLRDRFRNAPPVGLWRQIAFSQGVVVLVLALASPLDQLADQYLFTAHMVQHLLVTLVAAPLLLAGTPGWFLRELLVATRTLGLARAARHPFIAFFSFNLVFALSHIPVVYELFLANKPLHALEHVIFLVTAILMWMPVLSPVAEVPRYPDLGQVLYLFLQSVPASLVGALLSGAGSAYYATYVLAPRILPLTPLDDQQAGGLLMWVGTGLYFLLATAVVFFMWASREEAANRRPIGTAGGRV